MWVLATRGWHFVRWSAAGGTLYTARVALLIGQKQMRVVFQQRRDGRMKERTLGGVLRRYISSTPSGAARKAFSQYYRYHKKSGRFTLEVHIAETTSGSAKKVFKYKVSKVNEKNEVVRDNIPITYKYTTKVKAI